MNNFKNNYIRILQKENKLVLKGLNNKILNSVFSKKFDFMEKKILISKLPPLYNLEINHIYSSHISQRRNSIKYLHSINKTVLKNKSKSHNIIENNKKIIDELLQDKDISLKKSFFEISNLREIYNLWDYTHDYCERKIAFYSSRFIIYKLNSNIDTQEQKIFEGHKNKIGTFSIHPKSKLYLKLDL